MLKRTIMMLSLIMTGTMMMTGAALADRTCKSETFSRTGGASELLYAAKKRARDNWRTKVTEKLGKNWSAWYIADDASYNCRKTGGKHVCVAAAKPCKLPIVIQGPRKVCSIYKINGTGTGAKLEAWAKHKARKVWKARVKEFYGPKFDTWLLSNDKKTSCHKNDAGEYVCTVQAKPCKFVLG